MIGHSINSIYLLLKSISFVSMLWCLLLRLNSLHPVRHQQRTTVTSKRRFSAGEMQFNLLPLLLSTAPTKQGAATQIVAIVRLICRPFWKSWRESPTFPHPSAGAGSSLRAVCWSRSDLVKHILGPGHGVPRQAQKIVGQGGRREGSGGFGLVLI